MSAQTSQAGSAQSANAANSVQGALNAALQTVNNAWRMYYFHLENGSTNDIMVPPAHYRVLREPGLKAISNRYSNLIGGPVEITHDDATGNIFIRAAPRPVGRTLASEKGPRPSIRKNLSGKLPRPPNSFILYRQQHHPTLKKDYPNLHNNEISLILGKQWRDESEDVKNGFKELAEELKKQHLRDHPDYQYQPRKPSEKKRRMTRRKAEALMAGRRSATPPHPEILFSPHRKIGPNENMVFDLGDSDLDNTALEAMLKFYNVGKPTASRVRRPGTNQTMDVPLLGSAALSSEATPEAQDEFNFYYGTSPVVEGMSPAEAATVEFNEDQEQIQQYAEDYEETFEQMMARYTSFYDE